MQEDSIGQPLSIDNIGAQNSINTKMSQPEQTVMQSFADQSAGDIHSLYQDLFLTDIKKQVESAQNELKTCKKEQSQAQRECNDLKKENAQLNATLKRYRKQLQELTKLNERPPLNLKTMTNQEGGRT